MKILALNLQTTKLAQQKDFYTQVLGLHLVSDTPAAFTVQAGATQLTWAVAAPGTEPHYHFAFNIPENKLQQARDWAAGRVTILQEQGEEIMHHETWNAHSFYFNDPAGNGLELIARHNLPPATEAAFGVEQILAISEISLGAPDALALYHDLAPRIGAAAFPAGREPGGIFIPTGDDHGLLLLAQVGRRWFVNGGVATASPVDVTIQGQETAVHQVPGLPYTIEVVPG